jgi:glutamyl-Q tRNA(Asp) synthetase
MTHTAYIGRFAPTPTGPLHFGSLLAALASYLDAKAHAGCWLVRIEDLDPPREDPHASASILRTLDAYGLHHDGEVRYQSLQTARYQERLDQLIAQNLAFPCQCSRTQLAGQVHLGRCQMTSSRDCAWRFLNHKERWCFDDRIQGRHCEELRLLGDFILKRRDGPWAYQLAVVSDDIDQDITHIVRGIDLIDSTARQAQLYQALQQPLPSYAHIPVALESNGQKLSKQNLARPLSLHHVENTLFAALVWLKQNPPLELKGSRDELLRHAIAHWHIENLQGLHSQSAPNDFLLTPS